MSKYGVAIAGKNIVSTGISKVWKTAMDRLCFQHPYAASIWAGYKSGVYISDKLFNTSNIAEKIINMNAVLDIKQVVRAAYEKEKSEFDEGDTEASAETFLAAVDVCFGYLDADCECAGELVDSVEEALISKIRKAFNCSSNAEVKQQIEDIRKNCSDNYKSLDTDWIRPLESDYPEEYENYKHLLEDYNTARVSKIYEIACPVDVYVYDENNNLAASVIGNKVYCRDDSEMTVLCIDDKKTLYFYDSIQKYTIQYIGTDIGEMDVTINAYGAEGETLRTVKHINIPLTEGVVYISEEDMGVVDELTYQLKKAASETVTVPTTDTADASQKKYTLSVTGGYIYDKDGISFSGEYYAGEKISIYANVPENYTWLKWTSNNPQVIVSDSASTSITVIMPGSDVELIGNSRKKNETPMAGSTNGDKDSGTSSNGTPGTGNTPGQINNSTIPKKNSEHIVGALQYKVTKSAAKNGTVTVTKLMKASKRKVTVPNTVKIDGYTFKVTDIGARAFKGMKKLKKAVIGANVRTVGSKAFYGCKNLKTITVKSKVLKSVGGGALKGINKKAIIKVPKAKLKVYKALWNGKGQAKTVKIK